MLQFKKVEHEKEDRVVNFVRWQNGKDTQNLSLASRGLMLPLRCSINPLVSRLHWGVPPNNVIKLRY